MRVWLPCYDEELLCSTASVLPSFGSRQPLLISPDPTEGGVCQVSGGKC